VLGPRAALLRDLADELPHVGAQVVRAPGRPIIAGRGVADLREDPALRGELEKALVKLERQSEQVACHAARKRYRELRGNLDDVRLLGLVQKGDVLIAVGKSGESDELNALLPRLRALGVKIVALTANPRSTLAKAAALILETPVEAEACPHNLAPTCSTTAALAAGDALAVALMKQRGFGRDHFALNHPGGRLGRRLTLKVSDVMRGGEDNPVVRSGIATSAMFVELTRKRAGAVSVVDARGRFLGLITDYDIRRCLEKGLDTRRLPVSRIMNRRPTTIAPTALAARAVEIMENRRNPFNVLPVVDARGRAVGMIQIHDLRARGL